MPKAYLASLLAALGAIPAASCRGEVITAQNTAPPPESALKDAPTSVSARSGDTMENCDNLPLVQKEPCYARQPPDLVTECERMRPNHCAPYARVYALEKQLEQLNAALLQATRKAFASYEENQPGYVKDVQQLLAEADHAWRAYRDASCKLDPFIQGMSRSEAADLTEACRASTTSARVDAIEEMISKLKEDPDNEQRKQ